MNEISEKRSKLNQHTGELEAEIASFRQALALGLPYDLTKLNQVNQNRLDTLASPEIFGCCNCPRKLDPSADAHVFLVLAIVFDHSEADTIKTIPAHGAKLPLCGKCWGKLKQSYLKGIDNGPI